MTRLHPDGQEQGKDTATGGESTPLAAAVAAMGALPVPLGHAEPGDASSLEEHLREALAGAAVADDLYREWQQRAERYRIAWRMARTRALATAGAADRAGARVRELQAALQDGVGALLAVQMERDALRAQVAELIQQRDRIASDTIKALAAGDDATRPADEDPIAYSLTEQAGCACGPQMRCPNGHCSRHYMCQDCGNCCSCRCAGAPTVEALHASSGAVIEMQPRPEAAP
jgi:hypothetical protein